MGEEDLKAHGREEGAASGLDRRRFIARAGIGTAVAGGSWIAPTVLGTNVAFAQGSDGDDGGDDGGDEEETTTTTSQPDPVMTQFECSYFPWPQDGSGDPTTTGVRDFYPVPSHLAPAAQLTSVTSTVVGPNPPSVHRAGHQNSSSDYRNLMSHSAPYDGATDIPGGSRGLILVQDNAGGGNTAVSSVVNYQEVTVAFNRPLPHVAFWVYGFSASTVDESDVSSTYRDTLGFDRTTVKVDGPGAVLTGSGSFGNPFRLDNVTVPSVNGGFQVKVFGPLQSFTMRYATVGGSGEQAIKLGDFSFGTLCVPQQE